jgi:hypothetical protein
MAQDKSEAKPDRLEGFLRVGKIRDELGKWALILLALMSGKFLPDIGPYALGFVFVVPIAVVLWTWFTQQGVMNQAVLVSCYISTLLISSVAGIILAIIWLIAPEGHRAVSETNIISLLVGALTTWTIGAFLLCLWCARMAMWLGSRVYVAEKHLRLLGHDADTTLPEHFKTLKVLKPAWHHQPLLRLVAPHVFTVADDKAT